MKHAFWRELRVGLIPVHSASARKLLLGKLPRKDVKVFTQAKVYAMGAPMWWTGDMIDSFTIANYGRSQVGLPALSVGE